MATRKREMAAAISDALISFLAHFMIITFTILEARRLNFKQLFSIFSQMFLLKHFCKSG